MEVTVINSRKGLCDMGDQHITGSQAFKVYPKLYS